MTKEELLETLKAVRRLFSNNSPFYISKLGAPITNGDQSRIDAVFIAVDAAIAREGAAVSAAMTPKTQSVCKHCHKEIVRASFGWATAFSGDVLCFTEMSRNPRQGGHEPAAEPASTGEPECGQFTGRASDGSESHCKKPRGHDGSCNPLHGIVFEAARPSEPSAQYDVLLSEAVKHKGHPPDIGRLAVDCYKAGEAEYGNLAAPQTSAEPHEFDPPCKCAIRDSRVKQGVIGPHHDPSCPQHGGVRPENEPQRMARRIAAPQSVSGDAPKVEEIAATVAEAIRRTQRLTNQYRDSVLRPLITEALRPYFPPASQTPKWRCFHCFFETSDYAKAEAHFGDGEGDAAICVYWANLSAEDRLKEFQDLTEQLNAERDEGGVLLARAEKAEKELAKLATPASTARTDAPKKCECGHKWHGDDPCQWIGKEEDMELRCECSESYIVLYSVDFAAPGSVPQAEPPKEGE